MHRKRSVAGLCPDPLGELTALAHADLAGFKSGGRDKGRRKGETTGGDRQLREGDRNEGRPRRGGRGEGTEESVRRMEAEISQDPAGAPKSTPGDAKCVTEILWVGEK